MKIIKVLEKKEPFQMKNGGTIYSVWAKVQDDSQKEYEAMVSCYTDKIALEDGAEFIKNDNCKDYKEEQKTSTKNPAYKWTQITIYAKSKTWEGKKQHSYTKDEYDNLFRHAIIYTKKLCSDAQIDFQTSLVSTYMIGAKDAGVKVEFNLPI